MIGLVLLLLLPTPTVWFSLDHKRNVSDGIVSRIKTLFTLDHKLYASDYESDSDSVVSENQPLYAFIFVVVLLKGGKECWKNAKHHRFPRQRKKYSKNYCIGIKITAAFSNGSASPELLHFCKMCETIP